MALRIHSSDIIDFEVRELIYNSEKWRRPVVVPDNAITRSYDRGGEVTLSGVPMTGMILADVRWRTVDAIVLEDTTPSVNININFMTHGYMHTKFSGLSHDLDMKAGRHNLVYAPESYDSHRICRDEELQMLHISIDREHFCNLIGTEGAWCERVLRNLEAGRPFSGMHGTGTITAQMQRLITALRHDTPKGPMRNLLIQSRTMELLALQLEQFSTVEAQTRKGPVPAADADRLHLLKLYLDKHFLEDLSLTQLSRIALLNEFKLKKGFKELFGATVFGYIKGLRMDHAMHLLRDHRLIVEEVADILGYEHAHHFSTAFKKHFGVAPSTYGK